MSAKIEYIPGTCNIGFSESKLRRYIGWSGLCLTIVLWIAFYLTGVFSAWRLVLFIPAALSAVGFIQAKMHFCVAFGFRGVFNVGSKAGQTDTVQQAEFRRKDRKKALIIILYSIIIGAATAFVACIL